MEKVIMQKVIIENYINGIESFLEENGYVWQDLGDDRIAFYYEKPEELFNIGFMFGIFYCQQTPAAAAYRYHLRTQTKH